MRIYRSIAELPPSSELPRSVAAIGNFDGVHRGHQEIIGRVRERGRALGAPAIAVTFDPHPLALLRPEHAPKLITPIPERLRLLEETGIDATMVLPFTPEFSMLTPREFTDGILCRALRVVEVHEGDTFRFGHDAAAGIAELRELGAELGFGVVSHSSLKVRGITVSSSEVRRRVAVGQLGIGRALLGRPFSILSTSVRGRGVGTKLKTPTINLAPYSDFPLCNAVTNAGSRPTFDGAGYAIESYLLDGPPSVELTEATPIEVCFLLRLRAERRFPSPEMLKAQIMQDVGRAQKYFRRAGMTSSAAHANS
jgi:riboflavin kinase/FMN adenylyltransferase